MFTFRSDISMTTRTVRRHHRCLRRQPTVSRQKRRHSTKCCHHHHHHHHDHNGFDDRPCHHKNRLLTWLDLFTWARRVEVLYHNSCAMGAVPFRKVIPVVTSQMKRSSPKRWNIIIMWQIFGDYHKHPIKPTWFRYEMSMTDPSARSCIYTPPMFNTTMTSG